jgi:hypothetical protein
VNVKNEWLAERGGKRLHRFPVVDPNSPAPEVREAACGAKVASKDIDLAETATFHTDCLLAAASTVCTESILTAAR